MNIGKFEVIETLGCTSKLTKGSRVKCVSVGEHASRWGSNSMAHMFLTVGEVYTLSKEPEVHSWHTKYYLEEFPAEKFNSAQFEGIEA